VIPLFGDEPEPTAPAEPSAAGAEPEVCRRCHRPLKDPVSLGYRIGPECRELLGIPPPRRSRLRFGRSRGGPVEGQAVLGEDNENKISDKEKFMSTTSQPSGAEILNTPMQPNDADADTIRGYLVALLAAVWDEGAEFSGKRPFGSSGWQYELFEALTREGHINGRFDEDGYLDGCDTDRGRALVRAAIEALAVEPETTGSVA
jgi:hypothetical protein